MTVLPVVQHFGNRLHRSDFTKRTPHSPWYKWRGLGPLIITGQQGLTLRSVTTNFSKQSPSSYSHRQAKESNITSSTQGASHNKGGEQISRTSHTTTTRLKNLLPSFRLRRSSYRISINAITVAGVRHRLASSNKGATSRVGGRREELL